MQTVQTQDFFARQFSQHQRLLFAYLVAQLGNTRDAEEALQETCVIMLQEQSRFQPGTDFVAWASTIAYNQVRKIRRQRRSRDMSLDPVLLDQIAAEHVATGPLFEARCEALSGCMEYVTMSDRLIVREVYGRQTTIKQAAEKLNRPVNTLYKALNRIRRQLQECIRRKLRAEDML
jgi:RNA polymerase sigma-70 factor, ECF subfamily